MMKREVAFALLLMILVGCNDKADPVDSCGDKINISVKVCEEEIPVLSDKCIIKEAKVQFSNGNQREKFVYFHDGINYYEIDSYTLQNDGSFTETPNSVARLSYDKEGKVAEVIIAFTAKPDTYLRTTYTYAPSEVEIQSYYITDGVVGTIYEYKQSYTPDSKDSVYYHEDFSNGINASYLHEVKGGNRVRYGSPSADGTCFLYGAKWVFNTKSYYDDLPNVLREYAVRFPFNGSNGLPGYSEQFWLQGNANNIIAGAYDDGVTFSQDHYCWTFLRHAESLWLKKLEVNGTIITYQYDCE